MNRFLITAIIMTVGAVNQVNAQIKKPDYKDAPKQNETKEVEKAKRWIRYVIADNLNRANGLAFNTNEQAEGKQKEIYTKKYMAYKNDAAEVDMDGGMSLAQFKKKWSGEFDVKYAGAGNGYLVSATDYGLIEVTRCTFKKMIGSAYVFETIITDTEAKINYKRDIKIIPSGNAFLIADVLEYN